MMLGREVQIPAGPGYDAYPAYAALPVGAKRGVVVLFELYGRMPEIDRVVERFAAAGYAAVEPDLYRTGNKLGRVGCIRQIVNSIRTGEGPMVERVRGAQRWLAESANLDDKSIGVIGFCLGGGFALAVAGAPGGTFGAVSSNYGDVPPREVLRGLPPTIGCYGERDRAFGPKTAHKLDEKLTALGVPHETHVFPEVGHSFLTDGHHPIGFALSRPLMHIVWNPTVAEEGWRRIFAFFDQHLA